MIATIVVAVAITYATRGLASGLAGVMISGALEGGAAASFKAVAHGVSRAMIAKAQGQNTRSAFISGFMSSGFAAPKEWGFWGGTMATATVSGTVSQQTGGKFANGAMTGAFIHMFNAYALSLKFKGVQVDIYQKSKDGKSIRYFQIRPKKGEPYFALDKVPLGNKLSNELGLDKSKSYWHYHRAPNMKKHRPQEGW
jgi:hypothetical protein